MNSHVRIVAILHIVFGALSLLTAVIVFISIGVAGAITITQGEHEAAGILGIIALALTCLLTVLSLPGLIGGWALLTNRSWGRPLVIVLGFINLLSIPFGTALGIYTLWALLKE